VILSSEYITSDQSQLYRFGLQIAIGCSELRVFLALLNKPCIIRDRPAAGRSDFSFTLRDWRA